MASQIQQSYIVPFSEPAYSYYSLPDMSSSSSYLTPNLYPTASSSSKPLTPPAPTKQIHRNRASYSCHCCRRRKVKCDQVHPTCGNCKKHGDECTYSDNSHVKSKKKDGVKKSSTSSASMTASRSKQSEYDFASRLSASPSYPSHFPSVTPITSPAYSPPASSSFLSPPSGLSSGYPSPQQQSYSPSYYHPAGEYHSTPTASTSSYYDYGYSSSAPYSSIPATAEPMYATSSLPPTTYGMEDSSYTAYSSAPGYDSYYSGL